MLYPAHIEQPYRINPTFTYTMQSGSNLCLVVSRCWLFAVSCCRRNVKLILALIPVTLKPYKCMTGCIFCKRLWIWNGILGIIHGALHSFMLTKSFHRTALWDMLLLASIHRLNLFSIHFLNHRQYYSNQTHRHLQTSYTGNKWGCFPSPRGSALCLKSHHFLYEGMLILGCFAKCQWVVIYL